MHVLEREAEILRLLDLDGFVETRRLGQRLRTSMATLRRDLRRLASRGAIQCVLGGALPASAGTLEGAAQRLANAAQKAAIGRAAAALCQPGEAVILDGGTTTLEMCAHLAPLRLQVLTNSLPVVAALLAQPDTSVLLPAGAICREQGLVLSPFADDGLAHHHAGKMFMGAAAVGPRGLMQSDVLLVQAERKLIDKADRLIVLADSSKFRASARFVLCDLAAIDTLITDSGASEDDLAMLRAAGIEVIVV